MPEFNQNFIKGRMNKDLDERLVPNGEYRDALNVAVSTSEDNHVGTVQTLKGNTLKGSTLSGFCVGSIADEKTNKIYYFVSGTKKDAIIEYDSETETEKVVLVDIYEFSTTVAFQGIAPNNEYIIVSSQDNIRPGMIVTGTLGSQTFTSTDNLQVRKIEEDTTPGLLRVYLEWHQNNVSYPTTDIPSNFGDSITFTADRVLNFDQSQFITAINVIDDYLFWTDNRYEPKQINITNSCLGSDQGINKHTVLKVQDPKTYDAVYIDYNNGNAFAGKDYVKEEHITVIKKSPLTPPVLEMANTKASRTGGIYAENSMNFADPVTLENDETGTQYTVTFTSPVSYFEGDILICTNDPSQQGNGVFPSHEVRLEVITAPSNVGASAGPYVLQLMAITSQQLPGTNEDWFFLLDQEKSMFSFKFPRFGYRYKYDDGQYSTFSPFSEVAFLPSTFDYFPKKGFNLGMVNDLRFLKIKDFVPEPELLPKGVVAIDILYKESNSPNVYTVKTVLYGDDEWNEVTTNGMMKGATIIESELIYATLPANQLLRPWDNVPRKALAQEVTGNRLVYGNYLQNYNLVDIANNEIKVDIIAGYESAKSVLREPEKSIKTLRTYQMGVVYRDTYGRETPVLSASQKDAVQQGTIDIPKHAADNYNRLTAKIINNPPVWAEYFKIFVKETSNEYYNLAMDRWYNAEDGNIWISFPSKERNKVDIDTVLILKKQHDNDVFVADTSRYRVLAVENEAPQFVKKKRSTFGSILIEFDSNGEPLEGRTQVYPEQATFANSGLIESLGKSDLVMRVKNTGNSSNWYTVGGVSLANAGGYYIVTIDGVFGSDMAWTDPQETGTAITGLELEIAQNTFESRPEFDGRFFVKIFKDVALENNILHVSEAVPNFAVKSSRHHFYLNNQDGRDADWWEFAWSRNDLFIDGESRGLTGMGHQSGLFQGFCFKYTHALAGGMGSLEAYNDGFWAGHDGPFPTDDGYGLNANGASRPSSLTNGGKIPTKHCIELSVSKLKDGMDFKKVGAYDLSETNQYAFWQALSSEGCMFRWRNDPDGIIWVVESFDGFPGATDTGFGGDSNAPNGHGILNYSNADPSLGTGNTQKREENDNKCRRMYLNFRATDAGWRKDSQLTHVDPITGITNDDPDFYIADADLATCRPWWKGGQPTKPNINPIASYNPPSMFDPTKSWKNYIEPTPTNVANGTTNYLSYPAAATSIGHSNKDEPSSRSSSELGSPGDAMTAARLGDWTNTIEIIDIYYDDFDSRQSDNPGIWETEPKEDIGLDIYYEASQAYPLELNGLTNEIFAPYKSIVKNESNPSAAFNSTGAYVKTWDDNRVYVNHDPTGMVSPGDILSFTRPDGSITRAKAMLLSGIQTNSAGTTVGWGIVLSRYVEKMKVTLPWFNCYSFGNGVESNRVRDDFNQVTIDKGPKASTTLAGQYKEERRGTGLIYSGIYNSNSGINDLNQFIMAEPITKDLNPRFGSIQKLHSRDTDIVTCCEDKILKILANKDAVFNADGNVNLTATNRVLGQVIPFTGEYGISKNPESYAFQAFRSYFTDKARGVVLRLSRDGLTPISDHGMKDFFADNLRNAYDILGSYDDKKRLYNVTLKCVDDSTQSGSSGSGGSGTTVVTTNNELTGLNTDGNLLGHWFRYGGIVDDWAKAIENGAFGQGFTDIGNINANLPAGTNNAIGYTNGGHYKGWTGIQAGSLHPAGVFHGKEGKYGLNPGLANSDIILYFDHQTQGLAWHASFDATPNFDALINELNIQGPGNVYLYQTMFYSNFASHNPLLGCTGPFCTTAFQNWPYNWYGPGGVPTPGAAGTLAHQPEAVYSIKSIEYEASSKTYKMVVNWLVGYSGYQDFQTFKWSLDSPFITAGSSDGSCADNSVGTWDVNTVYASGTVVEYQGIYYVAQSSIQPGGLSPDNGYGATKWDLCKDSGSGGSGGDDNYKGVKDYTVSFSDSTNGWVSFKSWIQENGLSMNNKFYTFFGGNLWEHHSNESRNNFYNATYPQISTIDVMLNEAPNVIKSIDYLKYSGSQAAVTENISIANFDGEYYNNFAKLGWFVSSLETDMQSGDNLEFKKQENKWFAAVRGEKTYFNDATDTNIDTQEFSFQGIGNVTSVTGTIGTVTVDPPPPPPGPTRVILTIEDDPTDH